MPNYRRALTPGSTWFFTIALLERRQHNRLLVEHFDRLRRAVAAERVRRPFDVLAWVVLPEHMHWIWTLPPGDSDFPTRWRRIKTDFSKSLPALEHRSRTRVRRGERGIWQRRYWEHQIRDDIDLERHVDYIHYNPVKHGWVDTPRNWHWSSFRRWVERGHYPLDWGTTPVFEIGGDS